MKKTELSKICGVSRQMIYHLLNNGSSEEEILMKYFNPKEIIKLMDEYENQTKDETVFLEGVNEGYKQCQNEFKEEVHKMMNELRGYDKAIKDLKTIKEITKKVVLDNWKLSSDIFEFKDVNEIYEIVKDY